MPFHRPELSRTDPVSCAGMDWVDDPYRSGPRTKLSNPSGLTNAQLGIGTQWGAYVRL